MNKTYGILPSDQKYFSLLKKNIRYRLREASFSRINVDYLYDKKVFHNLLKGSTDAVFFSDPTNDAQKVLLPDLSLGVLLSYIQNNMDEGVQPCELFAIDSEFSLRNGEMAQTMMFDFEVIGERDAALDAQIISRAYKILTDCGLKDYIKLQINDIGGKESMDKINSALHNYYFDKLRVLPKECQKLFDEEKYLELLTYPDEDNKILAHMAPKVIEFISDDEKKYFETFQEYLTEIGIPFEIDSSYINFSPGFSGLMYKFSDINSKEVLIEGGRYDDLIGKLSKKQICASGAKGNMINIINKIKEYDIEVPFKDNVQIYVAQLGPKAKKKSLSLLRDLRETGIHTMGSMGKSGISAQFQIANSFEAEYCLLLGEQEVLDGMIIVKDLKKGTQKRMAYDKVVLYMIEIIGKDNITHFRDIEE